MDNSGAAVAGHAATRRASRLRERISDPSATFFGVALVLVFVVPTRYSIGPAGIRLTFTLGLGLIAMLTWVSYLLFHRGVTVAFTLPRLLIVLYLLNQVVSIAAAYRRPLSPLENSGTYRSITASIGLAGLALMLADGVKTKEGLRRCVQMTLLGGYFSSIVGIGQRVFKWDYDTLWRNVPGLNSTLSTEEVNGLLTNRATGTGSHPIEFSVACACLIPLAINQMAHAQVPRWVYLHRVGVGLLLIGALLGVSRAGFIGVVIGLALSIGRLNARQRVNACAFGLITLAIVQFSAHGTLTTLRYQLLNIGSDNSSKGRTADYGPVFGLVKQHLWSGIGVGTYNPTQYRFLDNAWLGILVGGGVMAVVVLGLIYLSGLYEAGRLRRAANDAYLGGLAYSCGVSLAIIAACAYFFDEFSFVQTQTLSVVLLGILGAVSTLVVRQAAIPPVAFGGRQH